jgi:hypothetical protein
MPAASRLRAFLLHQFATNPQVAQNKAKPGEQGEGRRRVSPPACI